MNAPATQPLNVASVSGEEIDRDMSNFGEFPFYFGKKRRPDPIAWPGHGHHETPSILVKVSGDGQTAVMSAPYVIAGVNDKGEGHVSTGGYRAFFQKTGEGWEIAELYAIDDHPRILNPKLQFAAGNSRGPARSLGEHRKRRQQKQQQQHLVSTHVVLSSRYIKYAEEVVPTGPGGPAAHTRRDNAV